MVVTKFHKAPWTWTWTDSLDKRTEGKEDGHEIWYMECKKIYRAYLLMTVEKGQVI
jgi:hypothetical protein